MPVILDEDHYYQFMEFKKYHQLILLEVNYNFQILETINLWRLCIRLSKLISTTPFSLLISSKSRSSGSGSGSGFEKLFVNLVLDGTTDWAILDKSALQVYTGNSLSITMHKLPKFISKKLSRSLKKDKRARLTLTNWRRDYFHGKIGIYFIKW